MLIRLGFVRYFCAQGGAGADDEVQGDRRAAGAGAGGVLRAAVHPGRAAHLRGHHHLSRRPGVISSLHTPLSSGFTVPMLLLRVVVVP